jgi:GDP-L-fucose synthase
MVIVYYNKIIMGKVLVTGGSGFLGKALLEQLKHATILSPRSNELNLLDAEAVKKYVAEHKPAHIIHAAGFVGGIGLNKQYPSRMALDNLKMGVNILEAAANIQNATVTIISTICVYPADANNPITESSLYQGYPGIDTAPYGLAKLQLLSIAEALQKENKLNFNYLILTNLYGPHDHFQDEKSHFLPAIIKRVLKAKKDNSMELVVWGDGSQTRDLVYVDDAANAIVSCIDRPALNKAVNIGSGVERSIREFVESICNVTNFNGKIVWDTTKPTGVTRRQLNIERARTLMNFNPQISLSEGIKRTVAWAEKNIEF